MVDIIPVTTVIVFVTMYLYKQKLYSYFCISTELKFVWILFFLNRILIEANNAKNASAIKIIVIHDTFENKLVELVELDVIRC